ncbi:MAG TPA: YncE family protein, partial [Methylomirabilota bacterium]|nr:YncE family protein [Methylomirabilota bacterium]
MKWMVIALGIAAGLLLAGSPGAQAALSQIQVTQTVKVGRHPSGVAIDPGLSVAVTANQNGRSASIIDLGSGIVRDVPVGLHPVAVAVNPDTHEAVVANASSHSISVFSLTAIPPTVRTIPVGRRPVAVAVHPGQNRAVVANQHTNTVSVVDLASGSVVATLPVGRHPSGVAVNPATGMAAVTNQLEDTATLIDLIGSAVHSVIVLDRANFQRKHLKPTGIDYDTTTNSLAVANTGDDSVSVLALDGASRPTSQAIVPVGKKPFGIAVSSGNDFALVTSDKDDVFALDLFDRSVFAKADVGKRPRGVAVDPASCRAVVTNTKDDTISVLRVPCNVLKLDALDPTGALMGSGPLTLILSGTGFVAGSVVNFGPSPALVPSAISPLSITVTVPASRLTSAGTIDVSVKTPSETSNRLPFVVSRFLPPILTGLTPSTRTADFQDWVLTVSGSNFRPDAVITFNGCPLSPSHPAECPAATTVVDSSTKAHATVPAILVAQGAVAPVSIVNPDGVASNSLAFLIVNPVPVLSTLTPNNAEAGAGDTEVVAIGSSFVLSSQVLFCGATCTPIPAVPLLANPPVQINATIPASLLTTPGVYAVRVFNP